MAQNLKGLVNELKEVEGKKEERIQALIRDAPTLKKEINLPNLTLSSEMLVRKKLALE